MHVDQERCQGHGRCYSLAPEVFEPDDIGNGFELHDGIVPAGLEELAHKAVANCPENAIDILADDTDQAADEAAGKTPVALGHTSGEQR